MPFDVRTSTRRHHFILRIEIIMILCIRLEFFFLYLVMFIVDNVEKILDKQIEEKNFDRLKL